MTNENMRLEESDLIKHAFLRRMDYPEKKFLWIFHHNIPICQVKHLPRKVFTNDPENVVGVNHPLTVLYITSVQFSFLLAAAFWCLHFQTKYASCSYNTQSKAITEQIVWMCVLCICVGYESRMELLVHSTYAWWILGIMPRHFPKQLCYFVKCTLSSSH